MMHFGVSGEKKKKRRYYIRKPLFHMAGRSRRPPTRRGWWPSLVGMAPPRRDGQVWLLPGSKHASFPVFVQSWGKKTLQGGSWEMLLKSSRGWKQPSHQHPGTGGPSHPQTAVIFNATPLGSDHRQSLSFLHLKT